MMEATEELVKRALQKQGLSGDRVPGYIKELLQDIEARRAQLNYKDLLLSAIKRHASGVDRKFTWSKRSRRFGNKSQGLRFVNFQDFQCILILLDQMSVQEINDFLDIIDNFLKLGSRNIYFRIMAYNTI